MTLTELMNGKQVEPDFKGLLTVDDYVLAIDTAPGGETATADKSYHVLQLGVTGHPGNLNPEEKTRQFIRSGKQTIITAKQFTTTVSGTRYVGDEAQDFILSNKSLFGIGKDVETNFIFFNIRTGEGFKGKCAISVNSINDGSAGDDSGFSVDLKSTDSEPVEWDWTTASAGA